MLYNQTKSVKTVSDHIPHIVDRLEQKQKVHDMAAKILVQIEKIEQQQENILSSAAQENKQVLTALQQGIKENQETIQTNMVMLRLKMGIKPEVKS